MKTRILKINQEKYIQDLLEVEEMTLCHITIFFINAELFISIDQAGNDNSADFAAY